MATGKDRQRQLAREHYERQMRRRAEREARQKRNAMIGSTVGVLVVVGGIIAAVTLLGGDEGDTTAAAADPAVTQSADASASSGPQPTAYDKETGTCGYVAEATGPVKDVGLPPAKVDMSPKKMTINTNHGDIEIKLATEKAPCTVNSFAHLAAKDYFDGTRCHRIGDPKIFPILQCGDPLAKADGQNQTDGQGGPGYRIVDENLAGAEYKRGAVAMANSGPNTNGSQFFLVFGDTELPPSYTLFGTITKGLDVLDKIGKNGILTAGPDGTGAPKEPVEIEDVTISGKS